MNKLRISVQEYNVYPNKFIGYQEIGLHIIFDIKLGKNFPTQDQNGIWRSYYEDT